MTSSLEKLESKLEAISKQIEIAEEEIKQLEAKRGALKDLYEIKEIIVLALDAVSEVDTVLDDTLKEQEQAETAEIERIHAEQKSYANLMFEIKGIDKEGLVMSSILNHARMCGYSLETLDEPVPAPA